MDDHDMDDHDKRVQKILGPEHWRNKKSARIYLDFLRKKVKFPCRVTIIEDYPLVELYSIGGLNKEEYERIIKGDLSFVIIYELIEIFERELADDDICAKLKRLTDLTIFEIGLSWLECVDTAAENHQFIKDYVIWYLNY